jgi:GLEYA domain
MLRRPGHVQQISLIKKVTRVASINYSAGLYRRQYTGWPNQNTANPTWFDTATAGGSVVDVAFDLTLSAAQTNLAYQWIGYFKPDYTGTWTFTTNGVTIDDTITVWIGSSALSGYTTGNAVLNLSDIAGSGTVSLTSGTYYPIRVQYANNAGPGTSTLWYSHPGQSVSRTWTGKLFYNSATNGF